jgi:hypothetical protein
VRWLSGNVADLSELLFGTAGENNRRPNKVGEPVSETPISQRPTFMSPN